MLFYIHWRNGQIKFKNTEIVTCELKLKGLSRRKGFLGYVS